MWRKLKKASLNMFKKTVFISNTIFFPGYISGNLMKGCIFLQCFSFHEIHTIPMIRYAQREEM